MERFAGFRKADLAGVPVLWRADARYKTFRVAFLARRPLDGRAAARGLLPELLVQGTERDPSRAALARRMEELYAGVVAPSATKHGESHVLQVAFDSVAGAFLPGRPDQLGEGLRLLGDLLLRPRLVDGAFPPDVFAREQRNQRNAVRAEFDDKSVHARRRALALACEGEPYAIPEHGGEAAIAALDARAPEEARIDFLTRGELLLLAAGALPDSFPEAAEEFLRQLPPRVPESVPEPVVVAPRPRRESIERAVVQQSKLVLVFRFPPAPRSVWPARRLFANLLGGGPHARLFQEIRERRSLAYAVHAGVEAHKGLLLVSAGLDEASVPAVVELVERELGELLAGRCTAQELATAKAGILSALAAIDDSVAARLAYTFERWLEGIDREPHEQAELYAALDVDAVASAAAGVWLDHVYLLAPRPAASS